ncbi:MAG: DUF3458 domain-containing protein, partial [Rhizobiaceae bacterium]|nr:DUF3458 domain-containing protein [Rhizobiaceae bacterium]
RKRLMHIPLAFGLVGPDGKDMSYRSATGATVENGVMHLKKRRHVVKFSGIANRPVISLNRGFSAPVMMTLEMNVEDRVFLARNDNDPYGRWQAFVSLVTEELISAFRQIRGGKQPQFNGQVSAIAGHIAENELLEPAFRALTLTLPGEADIAREIGTNIDPDAICAARVEFARFVVNGHRAAFQALYDGLATDAPFTPDAAGAGRRALRNAILDYLALLPGGDTLAYGHFTRATNMTDRAAALTVLAHRHPQSEHSIRALQEFESRFGGSPLVMDKWFMIQASVPGRETADRVRKLMRHPAFSIANPNRVRALAGTFFSANQTGFHSPDGEGYQLYVDTVLAVEQRNPQVAARLATALRSWRSLEPKRQSKAREALLTISARPGLSADVRDIVERTLG